MNHEIISINPATLHEIGRVPSTPPQKVKEYLAFAKASRSFWRRMGFKKRASYLLDAREYVLDRLDEFARTITMENGKPLAESYSADIYPVLNLISYFAKQTEQLLKPFDIPLGIFNLLRRSSRIHFQPLGVVGIISPWNYPFSIPAGEVVIALICGNCVILKPSSSTPLVGQKIKEMFAHLPDGVFTLIQGDAKVGEALTESGVDKIIFTGSVEAGRQVMTKSASRLTPLVLELGGKDPMIVLSDADLDMASSAVVWGAFTNSGQCCASVERVYVHESVFDEFVNITVAKTKKLRQGNGLNPEVDIGTMTTLSQLQTVEAHVEDAKINGAKIHCGGRRNPNFSGYFYEPTVLTGVDHSFKCVREETFGPILPIMSFQDEGQAITFANDTPYGLTASVWTKNIKRGEEMALEIKAGTVMINDCVYTHALPQTPWGGVKNSGFGRTHSRFGLQEMVTIHHIHTNKLGIKDFWWYPYSGEMVKDLGHLAKRLTGSVIGKLTAIPSFLRVLRKKRL